ncbi:MAG: four helix bundle protein [Pyrinomonadaceae bacterium]
MEENLKSRTKDYAVRIIKLYSSLPKSTETQVIGKQLLRSGTSVGAHYRESQFAKSDADFISKIEGGLQELEETAYWLELLEEMKIFDSKKLQPIRNETSELTAIFITIVKKVKARR